MKLEKSKKKWCGSKWNRQVAINIHLDESSSLGSNVSHFIECLHEMGMLLLKLVPSEPLSLVQELAKFENPIQLDILLVSVIDLCVCNLIIFGLTLFV